MAQTGDPAPRPAGRKSKAKDKAKDKDKGRAKDKKEASPAKAKRSASRARPAARAAEAGRGRTARETAKRLPRSGKAAAAPEVPPADPTLSADPMLSEEERIESAKYLPVASKPRVFEEERFLFPESYGVNRLRLHVKDPEWLFAHWDVDPASLSTLREEVGERALALSRVTLRVVDTGNGGASVILLPPGAKSWYVRTAQGRRSYRAELGVTLPSGEFRRLAESNSVVAPRGGPSAELASERRSYRQARVQSAAATEAAARAEANVEPGAEPWSVPPQDAGEPITPAESGKVKQRPGGASDVFRR